jgi:hypothetical protein
MRALIEATAASDRMMRQFKVGADLADEIGAQIAGYGAPICRGQSVILCSAVACFA